MPTLSIYILNTIATCFHRGKNSKGHVLQVLSCKAALYHVHSQSHSRQGHPSYCLHACTVCDSHHVHKNRWVTGSAYQDDNLSPPSRCRYAIMFLRLLLPPLKEIFDIAHPTGIYFPYLKFTPNGSNDFVFHHPDLISHSGVVYFLYIFSGLHNLAFFPVSLPFTLLINTAKLALLFGIYIVRSNY